MNEYSYVGWAFLSEGEETETSSATTDAHGTDDIYEVAA